MLPLFRPKTRQLMDKKFENFSQQLVHAFAQIKTDIQEVNSKLDNQQSELERMGQWIAYLNRHGQRLSDSHTILSRKQDRIEENHKKLHSSHHETAARHDILTETLENRHKELSSAISAHKSELKNALNVTLEGHKELTRRELDSLKAWISHVSGGIERQSQKSEALKQEIAKAQHAWGDTNSSLRETLNALRAENEALKGNLSEITKSIENHRKELEDAKDMVKTRFKAIEAMKSEDKQQLQQFSSNMQPVQQVHVPVPMSVPMPFASQQVPQNISSLPPSQVFPQSGFERHIMSRVLPNRKGYVVKFILDLVAENRFSTKEIEEIVVKEKGLCGRTSFYAYLKELKYRGRISTANIDERAILVSTERQQTLSDIRQDREIRPSSRPPERPQEPDSSSQKDFDDMVDDFHSE